ncbi:splicing factor 3B subunit 4 isoform X3 [Telopea speciosissima]|uniref:splicing factor 3B subunit 4 isoform X3 n=1 Tax=Telopea speciosissima TaxID=54955 RepID=UPI001CC707BA|nr:splicing factor 3B subunit 4 isoform X3 [Telopea speciosissima]
MPGNPGCTVYIGNLDEKVSDKVLYEILIQVGRVVDLYIPRDKETNRPKGYAFAEYETEEVADYAVRLFSGLVTLYNRTLKFAISGQDKPSQNLSSPFTPTLNSVPKPRFHPLQLNGTESFQHPLKLSPSCSTPPNYAQGDAVPCTSTP